MSFYYGATNLICTAPVALNGTAWRDASSSDLPQGLGILITANYSGGGVDNGTPAAPTLTVGLGASSGVTSLNVDPPVPALTPSPTSTPTPSTDTSSCAYAVSHTDSPSCRYVPVTHGLARLLAGRLRWGHLYLRQRSVLRVDGQHSLAAASGEHYSDLK